MNNIIMVNVADLKEAIRETIAEVITSPQQVDNERDTLLSSKELCDLLNVSSVTLWRMQKEGRLQPQRVGRKVVFSKNEVMALVKEGKLSKYCR